MTSDSELPFGADDEGDHHLHRSPDTISAERAPSPFGDGLFTPPSYTAVLLGWALAVVAVTVVAHVGIAAPIIGAEPPVAHCIVAVVGTARPASVISTAVAAIELATQQCAGGKSEEPES